MKIQIRDDQRRWVFFFFFKQTSFPLLVKRGRQVKKKKKKGHGSTANNRTGDQERKWVAKKGGVYLIDIFGRLYLFSPIFSFSPPSFQQQVNLCSAATAQLH